MTANQDWGEVAYTIAIDWPSVSEDDFEVAS